ncbi:MAG: phage holin family protein [Clostridium sp.]|uniref:phage holin family protein n=1 Tax=Clostridium sp. TaxID=1506 RepID=UPI00290BC33F|nr:phage holin family protein [Clostridium sp.]MDU7337376.1 phage holin family protein [Clostridium sp.]
MDKLKAGLAAMFAVVSARLGILAVPVYLLILSSLTDYVTGIMASIYRKEAVSSYRSIRGIIKKILTWSLVGVGVAIDFLLMYAGSQAGMGELPVRYAVASLVAVWLTVNELLSILENIQATGVRLPPFLTQILQGIQKCVEKQQDNTLSKK